MITEKRKRKYNKEYMKEYNLKYYATNKESVLARNRKYAKEHPEIMARVARAYNKRHPEKVRMRGLRYRYGISLEDYDKLLTTQNGVCAVCGKRNRRELLVDHCHKTDRIRGLLCDGCNLSIGLMKDDIDLIYKLAEYLKKHG